MTSIFQTFLTWIIQRWRNDTYSNIPEDLGQINDIIKDACNKLAVLSRLRCHADVKHFKSFEDDDDGLNSEIGKGPFKYYVIKRGGLVR